MHSVPTIVSEVRIRATNPLFRRKHHEWKGMIKVPERYVKRLIEVELPTKRISAQPREQLPCWAAGHLAGGGELKYADT